MNRRDFMQGIGASSAWWAAHAVASPQAQAEEGAPAPQTSVLDADGHVGGRPLDALIDRYRYDLFDDFLPFMDAHIIDHEYGGFMTHANRAGQPITTNKRSRYEGRGIWVYAHLYRTLAPEAHYLDVARKSVEFLLRVAPEGDAPWPNALTREGEPIASQGRVIDGKRYPAGTQVYDDLFIANGFAEYARATGDTSFRKRAIALLEKCVRRYDRPDYAPTAPLAYMGPMEAPVLPGCRLLGVWMVMIRLCTQLLEADEDARVEAIADRCLDAILRHHHDAGFDLLVEVLNHDFSTPDNVYAQMAYTGHGIETLWMVLDEAVRRKDRARFEQATRLFKRHLEVSWDRVYQGWFRGCRHVDDHTWILDKALWVQEEALIGLMCVIEHTGADWAKAWLRRAYPYVIDNFPLKPHGYALWDLYPDRKVTFVEDFTRIGNFHHPRHLMRNLNALLRMQSRGGALSGAFA